MSKQVDKEKLFKNLDGTQTNAMKFAEALNAFIKLKANEATTLRISLQSEGDERDSEGCINSQHAMVGFYDADKNEIIVTNHI